MNLVGVQTIVPHINYTITKMELFMLLRIWESIIIEINYCVVRCTIGYVSNSRASCCNVDIMSDLGEVAYLIVFSSPVPASWRCLCRLEFV